MNQETGPSLWSQTQLDHPQYDLYRPDRLRHHTQLSTDRTPAPDSTSHQDMLQACQMRTLPTPYKPYMIVTHSMEVKGCPSLQRA